MVSQVVLCDVIVMFICKNTQLFKVI